MIASELGHALAQIDRRILRDGTKQTLEVNRPGRVVPHYQFVPSHHHPEPFGRAPIGQAKVHKKVGKKNPSRRK